MIIPQAAAKLSPDDQIQLVIKMVAHTPSWLSPRILPWMIARIAREHRVALLKVWHDLMPAAAFTERVQLIRRALEPALWSDLVAEIPELATLDET